MKLTMAFRSDPLLSFSADSASKTIALYLMKGQITDSPSDHDLNWQNK